MSLEQRLDSVLQRVERAAKKSGRTPGDVTLVAVTKTWSPDVVRSAYNLGLRHFGENYLQEAQKKMAELSGLSDIRWHFVGHLQSNKIKSMVGQFHLIHSVDRESVIAEMAKRSKVPFQILLEVQFVPEAQKSGAQLKDVPKLLEQIQNCQGVQLHGLMVMPPQGLSADESRAVFAQVRESALRWQKDDLSAPHHLHQLSMGTSDDFEVAVEMGSTLIRLGTVLFGERQKQVMK